MYTDLAADTLIEPYLYIRDNDVHAIGCVAGSMFDAIDRAKTHACLATRTAIGYDYGNFLWLLLLARNLGRSLRNDQGRICFFRVVCHVSVLVSHPLYR